MCFYTKYITVVLALAESTLSAGPIHSKLMSMNCQWKPWGPWSPCSFSPGVYCGAGVSTRKRFSKNPKCNSCTILNTKRRSCFSCCTYGCSIGSWSQWTACTGTCGGGIRSRVLFMKDTCGSNCHGIESEICNEDCCPSDCFYRPWSVWSKCEDVAGEKKRKRVRFLKRSAPCCSCPTSKEEVNICKPGVVLYKKTVFKGRFHNMDNIPIEIFQGARHVVFLFPDSDQNIFDESVQYLSNRLGQKVGVVGIIDWNHSLMFSNKNLCLALNETSHNVFLMLKFLIRKHNTFEVHFVGVQTGATVALGVGKYFKELKAKDVIIRRITELGATDLCRKELLKGYESTKAASFIDTIDIADRKTKVPHHDNTVSFVIEGKKDEVRNSTLYLILFANSISLSRCQIKTERCAKNGMWAWMRCSKHQNTLGYLATMEKPWTYKLKQIPKLCKGIL